tara:strand:- start:813 stop:1742 length:930 start_codon:yes stop_codon:yes gene_type:complete
MLKILVTTTSFQDSPGDHHILINKQNWDIDYLRGPLKEYELLNIINDYDGVLCGDDDYTKRIIKRGANGKLKAIAKYGVGLDKIDLNAAKKYNVIVTNVPSVNQVSVAEHVLSLLLTFEKNIHYQYNSVKTGSWKRLIGRQIRGKTIGIIGLGAIGKEVSLIMNLLGLRVYAYDINPDENFLKMNKAIKLVELSKIYSESDYITLHTPLDEKTKYLINEEAINQTKKDLVIVNTARGELVKKNVIINSLKNQRIRGYLCDVLEKEPIESSEEYLGVPNLIITPHVASRTSENIVNQGLKAVENLINSLC